MKRLLSSVCAITMLIGLPALAASSDLSNEKFAQRDPNEQQGQQRGGRAEGGSRVQSTPNRGPQGDID